MYEHKENRSTVDMTTLPDEELVRGIVASEKANETDARLVDELWRRVSPMLAKQAKFAFFKMEYCFSKEEDALSEAYVAAWDALRLYDASKGASLKTFLGTKVKYHFKDLWRQKADYEAHNESYKEECKWDEDDNPVAGSNYGDICKVTSGKYGLERREHELADACSKVRSMVTAPRYQDCLDLLMEAYSLGEKNAVPYVAKRLGCSRQQVYNILKQVEGKLPRDLAKEIRTHL